MQWLGCKYVCFSNASLIYENPENCDKTAIATVFGDEFSLYYNITTPGWGQAHKSQNRLEAVPR
ncbi:hypothetical protein YDYSG_19490 [Paenibacillus tyrfis]|nr:hypothetical protein YDYSG_19490 [Paenibacillus tyrfis]GMX61359.1 hypothetical protein Elgi_11630 [Paenibacillus elgii]